MRVIPLQGKNWDYTCRSYLVLGDHNRADDRNTLIDPGIDGSILHELDGVSVGIGNKRVHQIILTHSHYDHSGGAKPVKEAYQAKVLAFAPNKGVDELLRDKQFLHIGDQVFQVLHTPGHSDDSICLYCSADKVLFSGDTPIDIKMPGGAYGHDLVRSLERLLELSVEVIYPGHNDPVTVNPEAQLKRTMANIRASKIV